jgi:hypothetical protein
MFTLRTAFAFPYRVGSISVIVVSGMICAIMLAVGFGSIIPISSVLSELCDLLGIASGIVYAGLLDGE